MPDFNVQSSQVSREAIVEAIVLAFLHSPFKDLGRPGITDLLDENWHQIEPSPDVLRLQPILDQLKQLASFKLESAIPPLARIKTWEARLKRRIEVPRELTTKGILDVATAEKAAASCPVPENLLGRVLPSPNAPKREVTARNIPAHRPAPGTSGRLVVVGVVLALLVAGGVGGTMWMRRRTAPVDINQVSEHIPLASAYRRGSQVIATLNNPDWTKFPDADRKIHVGAALDRVRKLEGVDSFKLVDAGGKVLAEAEFSRGGAPSITLAK